LEDIWPYLVISILTFIIGALSGYLVMSNYYSGRFFTIAEQCEKVESIVPVIDEMDRES